VKFSYHAIRWGWDRKPVVSEVLDDVSKAGFEGVELWSPHVLSFEDEGKFRTLLDEKGLQLSSILDFGYFIRGVDYNFRQIYSQLFWRWRWLPKVVKFASLVGCERLILGCPGKNSIQKDEHFAKMAMILNKIGKFCNKYGVELSFHPHPYPHPYIIQTREQIGKLFDLVDPDLVHFALDTGLASGGIDVTEVIRTYRERINHVHFKDFNFKNGTYVDLGEGSVDFPTIMDSLRSVGYDSWIIIEDWYSPESPRTPLESARKSKEYVSKYLLRK